MTSAAVVGAGQCGLAAARLLAEGGISTTLVERLPSPGGQEPEGRPEDELADRAASAGVQMVLGTLAVRWDAGDLAIIGVAGAATLRVGALLLATGTRPATLGELGIGGDRCAGVFPGSAALHLIESGLLPGWHPVVYGGGGLAARCSETLLAAGARDVTVVSDSPPTVPFPARVRFVDGWRVSSVQGVSRVEAVWIERGDSRERIAGDALLLAAGRLPMRNVDGAIFPRDERDDGLVVPCHSSADPKSLDDATRTAEAAVAKVLECFGASVGGPGQKEV